MYQKKWKTGLSQWWLLSTVVESIQKPMMPRWNSGPFPQQPQQTVGKLFIWDEIIYIAVHSGRCSSSRDCPNKYWQRELEFCKQSLHIIKHQQWVVVVSSILYSSDKTISYYLSAGKFAIHVSLFDIASAGSTIRKDVSRNYFEKAFKIMN